MPSGSTNNKIVYFDALQHKDQRVNMPTEEPPDLVEDDEPSPKAVAFSDLLCARDPSPDPQFIWSGKNQQALAIPAVPSYIQEKSHLRAIADQIRVEAASDIAQQASLFADFNDIACRFINTNYNSESFLLGRASFTIAGQSDEKLHYGDRVLKVYEVKL